MNKEKIKTFLKENENSITAACTGITLFALYKAARLNVNERKLNKIINKYAYKSIDKKSLVEDLVRVLENGKRVRIFVNNAGGVTVDAIGEAVVEVFKEKEWDLTDHVTGIVLITDK